jgi:4-hydroxy-2-oxoheptanedioate aldolase
MQVKREAARVPDDFGGVRAQLDRGETTFGYIVTTPSIRAVRTLAISGADWLVIDTEHNPISPETVHDMILATAGTGCAPMVRLPRADEVYAKPALDSGAVGIWIPHVDTPEEARAAVDIARFPPEGRRGLGPAFALDRWLLNREEYIERANRDVVVAILIESKEAVAALPALLDVDGVDVVSIARGDLATSLGHIGQENHPDVKDQILEVERLVRAAGKALGEVARSQEEARDFVRRGYTFITLGTDSGLLARAANESLADARTVLGGRG